jgi:hypothetical protein
LLSGPAATGPPEGGSRIGWEGVRERSVATSSWEIILSPSSGINPGTRLVINEIDDIELYINHRAVQH